MRNPLIDHYDSLIDENNDPVHDPAPLKDYMNKWDGDRFIEGGCTVCEHVGAVFLLPVDREREKRSPFHDGIVIQKDGPVWNCLRQVKVQDRTGKSGGIPPRFAGSRFEFAETGI